MGFISEFNLSGIEKHWQDFFKCNPMFFLVGNGFFLIPFETTVITDYYLSHAASFL